VSSVQKRTFPILLVMALGLSLLAALPAAAHPEACVATDDDALDEECEANHHKEGDESGESVYLDGAENVLGTGPDAVFRTSKNMKALGFSERRVPLSGPGSGNFNSDLAFWGKTAIQGTYDGFRIIDIADPADPREIVNYSDCVAGSTLGSQGDVVVWDDILVRSWDAPRGTAQRCGEVVTPAGQEGVHIFDIGDPTNPEALTFVATPCGSHTASGVPDPKNNRLLIYSSPSSNAAACRGIDIIEVPLDNPGAASYLRFVRSGEPGPAFPNLVTVDAPSSAAGTYGATAAAFGPEATAAGLSGPISLVNSSTGVASQGCGPLVDFPAGAIALADRGGCGFAVITANAQAAGASAVIVANNAPGAPITMGGADPSITIPAVMVSLANGNTIKAGLPATGSVRAAAQPANPDRACHDTGVILGDVLKAACAGGNGVTVWSMAAADGGSLEQPVVQYSRSFPGVTIGHSASFTWDGKVLVFGHEPGGGGQARCQEDTPDVDKTLYFLNTATGETVGEFLHPRAQSATENCTWHNYNVVPTDKGYVMVSGNYQAGISVINFTDTANIREIAFADPAPLSETALITGGDWSTYWYNGNIYQSDIRRGLIVWNLSDPAVAGAKRFSHSNPQTQETSFRTTVRPNTGRP
jgi:hypothetical protein